MADHPDDRRRQAGGQALKRAPDTIAAVSTASGRGGIGIVRVSGADLGPFAQVLVGRVPFPRKAQRTAFLDERGDALDEGLALYFPAPHSYTGEDVLELHAHGGPMVLRLLLARCVQLGARIAEPGEFTRRAFLNDKLDLAQAEAVADLIDASTETAARCALRSLQGEFSRHIAELVARLVELRMLVEATLDFPEEDVDPVDRYDVRVRLQGLRQALRRALEQGSRGSILRAGMTVVLAGRPNVGKSSILNRLAGEEIVIVAPVAGTTRDAVRQSIQVAGVPIHVVDTAGLRETSDAVESLGIQRTWAAVDKADLVLYVADARLGMQPDDARLLERLPAGLPRLLVFNKSDLCSEAVPGHEEIEGESLRVSALTGEGFEPLRAALLRAAGWQMEGEDVFLARERHLQALEGATSALERAEAQMAQPELLAEELRVAQGDLNAITGEFGAEDLLGEIFQRFCIGK